MQWHSNNITLLEPSHESSYSGNEPSCHTDSREEDVIMHSGVHLTELCENLSSATKQGVSQETEEENNLDKLLTLA